LQNVEIKSSLGSRRIECAGFDSMGRETARREWIDGVAVGAPTYSQYGKLGELTRVKRLGASALSWQFDYDALGNLLKLRDLAGPSGIRRTAGLSRLAIDE
jgi:YD repeat-containing protein